MWREGPDAGRVREDNGAPLAAAQCMKQTRQVAAAGRWQAELRSHALGGATRAQLFGIGLAPFDARICSLAAMEMLTQLAVGWQPRGWRLLACPALRATKCHAASNPVVQRYEELVTTGVITHDQRQATVVAQLAQLYDSLRTHAHALTSFRQQAALYQAAYASRFSQLMQERDQQKNADSASAEPQASSSGWLTWLRSTATDGADKAQAQAQRKQLTPEQRRRLLESECHAAVVGELGAAPRPPPPPPGVYLCGSVGSGKTLLMVSLDAWLTCVCRRALQIGCCQQKELEWMCANQTRCGLQISIRCDVSHSAPVSPSRGATPD